MNLRQFLVSIPAALFSAKSLAWPKPVLVPPKQVFPSMDPVSIVGLWVQYFDHGDQSWCEPHLILSFFSDPNDPYQGQLSKARRVKFWTASLTYYNFWKGVERGSGKALLEVPCQTPMVIDRSLLCIDRWYTHLRFFKNEPNIDWSTVSGAGG